MDLFLGGGPAEEQNGLKTYPKTIPKLSENEPKLTQNGLKTVKRGSDPRPKVLDNVRLCRHGRGGVNQIWRGNLFLGGSSGGCQYTRWGGQSKLKGGYLSGGGPADEKYGLKTYPKRSQNNPNTVPKLALNCLKTVNRVSLAPNDVFVRLYIF